MNQLILLAMAVFFSTHLLGMNEEPLKLPFGQQCADVMKVPNVADEALKKRIIHLLDLHKQQNTISIVRVKPDSYYEALLSRVRVDKTFAEILEFWNEPHRYFHTESWHLNDLLNRIETRYPNVTSQRKDALILLALFHDLVYDPRYYDPRFKQKYKLFSNELRSAYAFRDASENMDPDLRIIVFTGINATEKHETSYDIEQEFINLDLSIFESDMETLKVYESAILAEFQLFNYPTVYKVTRVSLLQSFAERFPDKARQNLHELSRYVQTHTPSIPEILMDDQLSDLEMMNKVYSAALTKDKVIVKVREGDMAQLERAKRLFPFHQVWLY